MQPTCPNCTYLSEVGAFFCQECGSSLKLNIIKDKSCLNCNTKYPSSHNYCELDGERLLSEEKQLRKCTKCFKTYDNGITICPIDGGKVKFISKRSNREKHPYHSKQNEMFQNIFSFNGRIRRTEYGLTAIGYIIIILTIQTVVQEYRGGPILFLFLLYIPALWAICAQSAKRCHDLGNNGWYQLIPLYGFLLLFSEGRKGKNRYGENPKK